MKFPSFISQSLVLPLTLSLNLSAGDQLLDGLLDDFFGGDCGGRFLLPYPEPLTCAYLFLNFLPVG